MFMKKHDSFLEMVKDWTVNDYKTPGFKAEIIIDTLISEFIEEIIAYNWKKLGIVQKDSVKLLAKEFPIKTPVYSKKEYRNPNRVDYLVMADNTFYLVELKTSNLSLGDTQKDRMEDVVSTPSHEMWKFFFDILNDKTKSLHRKTKEQLEEERREKTTSEYFAQREARNSQNYPDCKKYSYAYEQIKKQLPKSIIDTLEKENYNYQLKIIYICLCKTKISEKFFNAEGNNIDCIYLDQYKPSVYNKRWEEVYSILRELCKWARYYEGAPIGDEGKTNL